jgi:very-short-patch-repair endonuclease
MRCNAYAVSAAPDAFFSHSTAAELWNLPLPSHVRGDSLHVSVAWPRRAPNGRGIQGHSVRADEHEVTAQAGLRLSTPARVWCELGALLDLPTLVAIGDQIVRIDRAIASVEDLIRTLTAFPGRRGRGRLERAIGLIDGRSESPQESRLRVLLVQANIGGLGLNTPVLGASGKSYRADFMFAERRVILEYQGDYHRERDQFRRDLTRTLDLQLAGWTVLQLGPDDIRSEAEFPARIRRLLGPRAR